MTNKILPSMERRPQKSNQRQSIAGELKRKKEKGGGWSWLVKGGGGAGTRKIYSGLRVDARRRTERRARGCEIPNRSKGSNLGSASRGKWDTIQAYSSMEK